MIFNEALPSSLSIVFLYIYISPIRQVLIHYLSSASVFTSQNAGPSPADQQGLDVSKAILTRDPCHSKKKVVENPGKVMLHDLIRTFVWEQSSLVWELRFSLHLMHFLQPGERAHINISFCNFFTSKTESHPFPTNFVSRSSLARQTFILGSKTLQEFFSLEVSETFPVFPSPFFSIHGLNPAEICGQALQNSNLA